MTPATPTPEAAIIRRLYNRSLRGRRPPGPDVPEPLRQAARERKRRARATEAAEAARRGARPREESP